MGKCCSRKDYLSMLIFVKEFYAKMTVIHLKKKDIVKSEEVWEESKYTKPLEITGRFANDATDHEGRKSAIDRDETFSKAFGVPLVIKKGEEPKKYDFFEDTFLAMCKPTGEDGIWWIGSGENRRRDDDEATQEEEAEGDDEGNKDDFEREAIIDEASC
ncbi:hypothetical protein Dimus_001535 [Dionaea muscipula]